MSGRSQNNRSNAKISFFFVIILSLLLAANLWARSVVIYTEEFPPFNYTADGKITGVATEIVTAVMETTGIDYSIESHPWARSYSLARNEANVLIYSIGRRTQRENLFHWLGVIVPTRNSVFCLAERSDIVVNTIEDLRNYQIATVREDAQESYLLDKDFNLTDFHRVSGEDAYYRSYLMLKMGRIDLLPMLDGVLHHVAGRAGDNPQDYLKKVLRIDEADQGGAYIAASPKTDEKVIELVRKNLEKFKQTKRYKAILIKWGITY